MPTPAVGAALLVVALVACQPTALSAAPVAASLPTHGTVVGEVSSTTAVVWGRCAGPATLHVRLDGDPRPHGVAVAADTDFTGKLALTGLPAATARTYEAWCGGEADREPAAGLALRGAFRTAPDPDSPAAVRFAWSGDVGGQNVCRDRERGYPIFDRLAERRLDFFIGLGDMIYADDVCKAVGLFGNAQIPGPPAAFALDTFRAHWQYNRADAASQRLLSQVAYYAVWDDHEIRNDSGPHDDSSDRAPNGHLLPTALRAFLDYQPLIPPASAPTRLYRSMRWGRHLELFLLDTRQYRDAAATPDTPASRKTMLGREQLAWLEDALARSNATWKVIVASVPLSIPTSPRVHDGFANGGGAGGYEREAESIFAMLRRRGIRDSVWITTDVHFATGFVYHPFDDDPGWTAYEFTSGPLNSGIFPTQALDPTLHPQRLFYYAPPDADTIGSFDDAVGWFNFGEIEVSAEGALTVSILNGRGATVFQQRLPSPAER